MMHTCLVCGEAHPACCGMCRNYARWIGRQAAHIGHTLERQLQENAYFLLNAMCWPESRVLMLYEMLRSHLSDIGRETDADVTVDVMDQIVGWCAPHMLIALPANYCPTCGEKYVEEPAEQVD